MKITKRAVNATTLVETPCCKYETSVCLIKTAIDELGKTAAGDEVAKDAIANLSVVLLDLSSSC